ncbi:hypothetical protein DFH06DRAFT_1151636 [Mycena polygramma]|nr:hypothetical protein DFH06DRAFT_1151636 [Mycena polygramma]
MTMELGRYPPTNELPQMSWFNVDFTRELIASEKVIRSKTVKAILVPDGQVFANWIWARVPLHADIQRAESVDELDTDIWFDAGRGAGAATSDLSNRSFQVDRFPFDEPNDLKHSYTIVVAPQHIRGANVHPINHQINALVPGLREPWRGNVLVFRHGKTVHKRLINVEDKNWDVIGLILTTSLALANKPKRFVAVHSTAPRYYPATPHVFWLQRDVVLYMLRFLGLMHIMLFSHIDQRCKDFAKVYLRGRIIRYTCPFFSRSSLHKIVPFNFQRPIIFERFFEVLGETRSWIVGSVALAAASVLSDAPVPTNLNIITYCLNFPTWIDFFANQSGFKILKRYWSTGPYAASGRMVLVLHHPQIRGYTVSITSADASNLGQLFFASPNTDQLIAISARELITPVLQNVSEQQHIMGWRPEMHLPAPAEDAPPNPAYRKLPRFPGVTTLDESTANWKRPCGPSCPGLPRITYGLNDFAHLKWGGLDGHDARTDPNLSRLAVSRMTFRFSVRCDNRCCTNSDEYVEPSTIEDVVEDDDASDTCSSDPYDNIMLPLYTDTYQIVVANRMYNRRPPLGPTYRGLLFGAGATQARYVEVPLRLGLSPSLTRSPDDIDCTWWIPVGRAVNESSIDLSTRLVVSTARSWTICAAPQLGSADAYVLDQLLPLNTLFATESTGSSTPFRGNVLVIAQSTAGLLVDVLSEDEALITQLVKWPGGTPAAVVFGFASAPYMSYHFFSNRELCTDVLSRSIFRTFVRLSHVNRLLRTCTADIFRDRIVEHVSSTIIDGTFRQRAAETWRLLELMDGEHACIVGSAIQSLICFNAYNEGPLHVYPPRDLNILVTGPRLRGMLTFLIEKLGLPLQQVDRVMRDEVRGLVVTVYVLGTPPRRVTVSCTVGPSVLPVLLASCTTSQMNALTRTQLVSFYPHLTTNRLGLMAWPAAALAITSVHDLYPGRLPPLSGHACQRPWRQVAGLEGVGIYSWVEEADATPFMNDRILWRIGEEYRRYCHQCNVFVDFIWTIMYANVPVEIETAFLEEATYLDLVRYSGVSRKTRGVVVSVLNLRSTSLLLRFLDEHGIVGFWRALNAGHGGITGSGPLWVTQYKPLWAPTDLNAVVVHNRSQIARNFLVVNGWTEAIEDARTHSVSHNDCLTSIPTLGREGGPLERVWRYTKGDKPNITLTETADDTVFKHLTWAPHTMATMLLTSSTIIALHPYECVRSLAIWRQGWTPYGEWEERASTSPPPAAFSTAPVPSPCGRYCTGLVRRLRGGKGVGLLPWKALAGALQEETRMDDHGLCDERFWNDTDDFEGAWDTVARDAYHGFMQLKYAFGWTWRSCENYTCDTLGFPRQIFSTLPAHVTLSPIPKTNTVLRIKDAVSFPVLYDGLLFATSVGEAQMVPVPLDHGLTSYTTSDDIRAHTWITPRIEGTPAQPFYWPPYEVVGSPCLLNALSWRERVEPGRFVLIFMASVHRVGPPNTLLSAGESPCRPVHGDVLLMLEDGGKISSLGLDDTERMRAIFQA